MTVPVIFSTGSLHPFGLDRIYSWAAEAGYDGVEIVMDERWDTHQHAYLDGKYGIPVQWKFSGAKRTTTLFID